MQLTVLNVGFRTCSINVKNYTYIGKYVLYILKVCAVNRLRMLCVYTHIYCIFLYIISIILSWYALNRRYDFIL